MVKPNAQEAALFVEPVSRYFLNAQDIFVTVLKIITQDIACLKADPGHGNENYFIHLIHNYVGHDRKSRVTPFDTPPM